MAVGAVVSHAGVSLRRYLVSPQYAPATLAGTGLVIGGMPPSARPPPDVVPTLPATLISSTSWAAP